jgi:hypothetical protein
MESINNSNSRKINFKEYDKEKRNNELVILLFKK